MVQFIFCKFLVGNSAITVANELRNIDITELRYLDFSNVNLKFLTLRSLTERKEMSELSERKEMSKRKHEKYLFSFGFKKKPPEKVSSK